MRKKILLIIAAWLVATSLYGQFYTQGQDPFSTRWRQINNTRYRIVYPEQFGIEAQRVGWIIDTIHRTINFGYSLPPRKLPIILHSQNLNSNGLVVWAPRRAELILTPPAATYASPWLKQLTTHEYRHVVQMSNFNRHFIKFLSWFAGEQASGVASAFLPTWFLEGDAVLAETQYATYGRALQPEFTIQYRAYLADGHDVRQFSVDKWFCGSYKDYIPDHYQLGYQLTNMSYKLYGPGIWNHVTDYSSKYPFFILPRQIALHRFYKTSNRRLLQDTFNDMKRLWDSLPQQANTARMIETPSTTYTLYSHPVAVNDTLAIVLKYDFDKTKRIVAVNPQTAKERHLAYTGSVSSRPVHTNGEVLWTEYRPSTFWEQRNSSVVRRMRIDQPGKIKTYPQKLGNLFYVTPYKTGFAAIRYNPDGTYALCTYDGDFNPGKQTLLPDSITIHGLAWDAVTNTMAMITLSESGMALTGIDAEAENSALFEITHPSSVTVNNLTAGNGKLAFNSIGSGKDESHIYDLAQRKEYRVTTSRFGSVMPSLVPGADKLIQTTYRREGYFLSEQQINPDSLTEVPYSRLPVNLINPSQAQWELPNIDSIRLYDNKSLADKPTKRYRKGTHLFGIHSWAPLSYDPFNMADERELNLNFGATVISQNTLSDASGYLSYGIMDSHSWWRGSFKYMGFAPKIEVSAEYDGGNRLIYIPVTEDPGTIATPADLNKKYFSLDARIFLPINLSSGYMLRSLTPSVRLTHYNALMYEPNTKRFDDGFQKGEASLAYAQNVRAAIRDLAPRWGFGLKASWVGAPFHSSFGSVYSLFGSVYTPGILPHHSLQLRAAAQYQDKGFYNFRNNVLFPRGCRYNFTPEKLGVIAADYRFPIAYPDWGIPEIIYIKRISANIFGGYSRYNPITRVNTGYRNAYSYGGELSFDTNPLRMSNFNMEFKIAVYKANDSRSPQVGFSVSVFK